MALRSAIAAAMTKSNREIPHFAYVEEIDITSLESLRRHLNSKKSATEDKLTLLPFIGLALAGVLNSFHNAMHCMIKSETSSANTRRFISASQHKLRMV